MNKPPAHVSALHLDGYLLLALGALTALGPLSTDAYLPALPAVADSFGRTIHDVELSISLFLAGLALGQLIGGPLSDHYGRRSGIQVGLSIFLIATGWIVFSASIEELWGWRSLQGIGAGITAVNVPAIIKDVYTARQGAQALSKLAIIMMTTPIISPLLGLQVTQLFSWRAIFLLLVIYACVLSLVIFFRLPETRLRGSDRIGVARRYWIVLRNSSALMHMLSVGLAYGSLFAYLTASPWLYMEYFGVGEAMYPLIFSSNVVSLILMSRLNIFLLKWHEPGRLLMMAKLGQSLLALVLFCYILWVEELNVLGMTLLLMSVLCWHPVLVANSMSLITELFPDNKGTATALMGGFGFALASLSSFLVGFLADGTVVPMTGLMFFCAALSALMISLSRRCNNRSSQH